MYAYLGGGEVIFPIGLVKSIVQIVMKQYQKYFLSRKI